MKAPEFDSETGMIDCGDHSISYMYAWQQVYFADAYGFRKQLLNYLRFLFWRMKEPNDER